MGTYVTTNTTNFSKGREGEQKVIYSLKAKGLEVEDYTDYSKFKHKQHKGYDIEVLNTETKEWDRIDIKSNCKNDFIYLEDLDDTKEKLGWFWTSSADYIYHYDLKNDYIYSYNLAKMRNYVFKCDLKPKYGKFKNLIGLKVSDINLIKTI